MLGLSRRRTLMITFLFLSSTFFSFSLEDQEQCYFPLCQQLSTFEEDHGMLVSCKTKRFLAENAIDSDSPRLILAAKRTQRKDPFHKFQDYSGGWNITDIGYWTSACYPAAPFFLVAIIWFMAFGLHLLIRCFTFCCCQMQPGKYSAQLYAISQMVLIFSTLFGIVGCIIFYIEQGRFYSSTTNTLDYVVNQVKTTAENLRIVSEKLAAAKQVGFVQVALPASVITDIYKAQHKINSYVTTLSEAVNNSKNIRDAIHSVRMALIVLSALMFLMIILGLAFSHFRLQFLLWVLVVFGWILATGTFILCGIFLFSTRDTCVALDEWVHNPTAHTSLDDILPCADKATALETLSSSKTVTYLLVDKINQVITNANTNSRPPILLQSIWSAIPIVPILCNPYNPDLTSRSCTAGEVDWNNAKQVWSKHVCQVSAKGICETSGRLSPSMYSQLVDGANVCFELYHYGAYLASLQDCSFVRKTCSRIHDINCPGMQGYTRLMSIWLGIATSSFVICLLCWIVYGKQRSLDMQQPEEQMPELTD